MSVVGLGAEMLNDMVKMNCTRMIMKNPRAACKVHDSVPQTVVNYFYFNQDPVKLSVKGTGNTKTLCGTKSLPVGCCKTFEGNDILALYASPLLGQRHKYCASQASYIEVNEENEGLYSFYK